MRAMKLPLALAIATTMGFSAPLLAADEDYRIVDKPLTLTIHFHSGDKIVYDSDWPVEKRAAELTGISLDGVASMATQKSADAFNLMIASGDLADIVGGNRLRDGFNQYGQEGAFQPLNDLIDEHAPNIKAFFESRPDIKAAISAADGNIYYIPYLPEGDFGRMYFIRQDWLDTLKLETPKTVDELYKVLTAFRNDDPNGNGKKDEVPFLSRDWEEIVRLVILWDARTSGSDTFHDYYVKDGKIVHGYTEDEYKTGMINLAKWYKEGLIDPEFFTRGKRSREVLFGDNVGGMTHDWYPSTTSFNDSLADKVPGFNLKAMPPPASPSGRQLEEHRVIPVKPDGWAISYSNEHPVETIKYFDFWFTELGRRLSNFGVEGVHYDLVDGKAIYKPEVLNASDPVNAQMWNVGAQIPKGFLQDFEYQAQWTNEMGLESIALYEAGDYLTEQFLGVSMNPEEQNVYDKYQGNLLTYMLEMQQIWILGSEDVEAGWDKYQEQLDKLGYNKIIEAMQSAYDRQYGS